MQKNYQALIEDRIFLGGASDVKDMVDNEHVEVIVDLRGEATECAYSGSNVEWLQVPLGDNTEGPQDELFKQAIIHIVETYKGGKKVGFHCGGGKGRTGAVAIGTLIALGKCQTIEEAEKLVQSIRPVVSIKQPQRETLEKLFNKC